VPIWPKAIPGDGETEFERHIELIGSRRYSIRSGRRAPPGISRVVARSHSIGRQGGDISKIQVAELIVIRNVEERGTNIRAFSDDRFLVVPALPLIFVCRSRRDR